MCPLLVVAVSVALTWERQDPPSAEGSAPPSALQVYTERNPLVVPRLVYPYSIVPGGVGDGAELRQAIERDPVAAAHYAGFRVERAIPAALAGDRLAHVSYRVHDRVYWTRRKVLLRKGEPVLTDGTSQMRTRCGNRIADRLRPGDSTSSELEPPEQELDAAAPPGESMVL